MPSCIVYWPPKNSLVHSSTILTPFQCVLWDQSPLFPWSVESRKRTPDGVCRRRDSVPAQSVNHPSSHLRVLWPEYWFTSSIISHLMYIGHLSHIQYFSKYCQSDKILIMFFWISLPCILLFCVLIICLFLHSAFCLLFGLDWLFFNKACIGILLYLWLQPTYIITVVYLPESFGECRVFRVSGRVSCI